jgi:pantoate--beta-alanine ligase
MVDYKNIITSAKELYDWSSCKRESGIRVGLVTTMGGLHEGHISLIRAAERDCEAVVVSIFVNPKQFGRGEDFDLYPRTLDADVRLIDSADFSCEVRLFVPSELEMYSSEFNSVVRVGGITERLEGSFRPAHFDGVSTVVLKLFNISNAQIAYFGLKDYQQLCVIGKMVIDLNVPITIIACPTVRDADGVALSSRNTYLSASQREQATVLSQSLLIAENLILNEGCREVDKIIDAVCKKIQTAADAKIDYVTIVETHSLRELKTFDDCSEAIILLAVKIGTTRLIDNKIIPLN